MQNNELENGSKLFPRWNAQQLLDIISVGWREREDTWFDFNDAFRVRALASLLPLYKFSRLSFGLFLRPRGIQVGGVRGVPFFLWLKQNNGCQKRGIRSSARGAATRHERVPPIDPSLHRCFAGEGEERERESGQPILSLYRDLRTHPCEKLFSFSFHRVLTRLSRKRKNSLASTFPTNLWQTVFVHFFSLFFFLFPFFRTPDSRNIGFSPSDYSENSDRFISTLVSV